MRRRKTRYQWLFNTGSTGPTADIADTTSGRELNVAVVAGGGASSIAVTDLLNDTNSDDETTRALPMGVYQNNEYFIKRIVGKFFCSIVPQANDSNSALVGLGLFIARAGDEDGGANASFRPIGVSAAATTFGTDPQAVLNYSPLSEESIREPWIWRRTWVIGNPTGTQFAAARQFPSSTAGYGSVADGGHIDAKTARRVKDGERLFAALAVRAFPVNSTADNAGAVQAYLDYRVLGAPRRARNGSAF